MPSLFTHLTISLSTLSSLFSPVLSRHVLHERLASVPAGWRHTNTPSDDTPIQLQIGLQLQNLDQLESKLLSISSPSSPTYGHHLTRSETHSFFRASPAAEESVISWLAHHGITAISSDGHWVNFATSVGVANALLDTSFAYFTLDGTTKLRTTAYSLPEEVRAHIQLVTPTTYFGRTAAFAPTRVLPHVVANADREVMAPTKRQSAIPASCSSSITPVCLKAMYNISYTPSLNSSSRIGFGSFLNLSASYADLALYEREFDLPMQNFSVVSIANGTNDQSAATDHGEPNLDVQFIIAVAAGLDVTEYSTGGSPPFIPNLDQPTPADNYNEPYVPYYTYLLSLENSELPQVISNSYGEWEDSVPENYARRTCDMIAMMGMRGITILESSGDIGVGSSCRKNDGSNAPEFNPIFPATCPYILSIGGTQAVNPEVAWEGSSGGFSNYFPRPPYQDAAVETYLNTQVTNETLRYYSQYANLTGGRGFPDISAHSLGPPYVYYNNGARRGTGGTSAAAPVVAAIIALLNDARFKLGKPALGFINPWLYSSGYKVLNDITGGRAGGCNGVNYQTGQPVPGGAIIPGAWWNGTVGWDPVTGWGTPDFGKLRAVVEAM
ncbi:subtilisin-like protein [Patellaria atrata CBS 101060]|uniref:tripeptidyl-peptidase II n=1 Tax=Patellaria atrata CBS 101060 TaxID=1346257 RepID=A0A9P4S7Q5_9PEZI|nr:subtilisin-like protein [Patellaria atrata CBS 101060]